MLLTSSRGANGSWHLDGTCIEHDKVMMGQKNIHHHQKPVGNLLRPFSTSLPNQSPSQQYHVADRPERQRAAACSLSWLSALTTVTQRSNILICLPQHHYCIIPASWLRLATVWRREDKRFTRAWMSPTCSQ